jgi:hypothetical protein
MRWLSVALACVTLASTSPAGAFVTPRWQSTRDRGRKAIMGTWRAVTLKTHNGAPVIEPGITIVFDKTTLRIELDGKVERGTWRVVDQEGDIVELEVIDEKGKRHDVDVLIESNTALTLYVEDDDGDDEEVVRVERVD